MSIEINQMFLTLNPYSRPGSKLKSVNGIIIHYVGNAGSTAVNNRNYFESLKNGTGIYASAHYIIGLEGEVIQCIPDNEVAWHAGKSYGSTWDSISKDNNYTMIGIENCHPLTNGKFNEKTYKSLIELTASLCKKYNLNINQVYRHYDRCGKGCPIFYVNNPNEWNKIKSDINLKINEVNVEPISEMKVCVNNGNIVTIPSILRAGLNYPNLRALADILNVAVDYDVASKVVKLTK